MNQHDSIGQILVFARMSGTLHMRQIASADLVDADIDDYEMVVFDGGNTRAPRTTSILPFEMFGKATGPPRTCRSKGR
ncbi:hypothetical protein, partial [Xanthomonas arboricola]